MTDDVFGSIVGVGECGKSVGEGVKSWVGVVEFGVESVYGGFDGEDGNTAPTLTAVASSE